MQWVLLAVLVAALLYMSRYFPKVAFSVLGVLVIAAIAVVMTTTDVAQFNQRKIPNQDIQIENPVLTPAYGGSFKFDARLSNVNESNTLREATISVTMLDCASDNADSCTAIGQQDERVNVEIPPGQARDISRNLSFGNASLKGELKWEIIVTQTRS